MGDSLAVRQALDQTRLVQSPELLLDRTSAKARAALQALADRDTTGEVLTAVRHYPAREAQWAEFPEWVNADLRAAYGAKGIARLYSHQAAAAECVHAQNNVVIVTPTASGKTLCYNLPVLHQVLENPDTRALYLFPTKALAQDQLAELHDLNTRLGNRFGVFTYDGDTPGDARRAIRERGHIVLTNPDMLHTGILPHHTKWTRLFENLKYIVMDELHTYRGVFGSHLCNVLRRLQRIAKFYGSKPQFICCSATIANPGELASRLIEDEVEVLSANGAPAGEKTFVFYNPPVVNKALGIRRSYINESARVAQEFLKHEMQTMVFSNSRLQTEVLLTYLQKANPQPPGKAETIRGYRGGYLPNERREIERGIRDGRIRGVVSTSALELGIDVGSLDSVVMAGYPGTIAATWQRAGRAGRRSGTSCAVMVASSSPLDQFIVRHSDYFFGNTPEHAYIQPDNLEILLNHLKCAAFELPIEATEKMGGADLPELLPKLAGSRIPASRGRFLSLDAGRLSSRHGEPALGHQRQFHHRGHYRRATRHRRSRFRQRPLHHPRESDLPPRRPAISRRTHGLQRAQSVREGSRFGLLHRRCEIYASPRARNRRLGKSFPGRCQGNLSHVRAHGDVLVRSQVVGFKKIKFFTNENIGDGKLELPENEMHTTSYWLTLERAFVESLPFSVSERQSGMFGLLHAMASVATLLLMCDGRDLETAIGERPPAASSSEFRLCSCAL